MKDYYKIINVPYDASADEIRKAYHKHAKKFHPDKNPDRSTATLFLDIQEAYYILSDEKRRQAFHLTTSYPLPGRKREAPETAYTILEKCKLLNQKISSTNKYRINPSVIAQTIETILSDRNGAIVLQENNDSVVIETVEQLMLAFKILPYRYVMPNMGKLLRLSVNNSALQQRIIDFGNKKKRLRFWEQYNFIIILAASLIICLFIFLLA